MFYSDCIGLRLHCFSVSDNLDKTKDVILHSQHGLSWSWISWSLLIKNLYPQSLLLQELRTEIYPLKSIVFYDYKILYPCYYTAKMLLAMKNNASKIM